MFSLPILLVEKMCRKILIFIWEYSFLRASFYFYPSGYGLGVSAPGIHNITRTKNFPSLSSFFNLSLTHSHTHTHKQNNQTQNSSPLFLILISFNMLARRLASQIWTWNVYLSGRPQPDPCPRQSLPTLRIFLQTLSTR